MPNLRNPQRLVFLQVFGIVDRNASGTASLREIINVYRNSPSKILEPVISQVGDAPGGDVTFQELLKHLWPAVSSDMIAQFMLIYDPPSPRNLFSLELSVDVIREIYKKFDTDHDGVLSLRELQTGLTSEGLEEVLPQLSRFDVDGNEVSL